jgi:hypothetical protein
MNGNAILSCMSPDLWLFRQNFSKHLSFKICTFTANVYITLTKHIIIKKSYRYGYSID